MPKNDMTFRIGGEAGQGVASGGVGFATAMARAGLHVSGYHSYMSRVRGGQNYYEIRVSGERVWAHRERVNLLMALLPETIDYHLNDMEPGAGVIYDETFEVDRSALESRGLRPMPMPLVGIAEALGNKIMSNTAAFGAAAGVTQFDLGTIEGIIRDNFGMKGPKVVDANLEVARRARQVAAERYPDFAYTLEPLKAPQRMTIDGNQAFCLGALLGGCRFVSAYPMTPATAIIEWFTRHAADYGLVTKHTEDEIAAVCMAIGASHAGVRAMTATSGGGFSLMVEGLGLAAMTETPLVMVEAQRPGPATGMPTRTEQADLHFVIHASQGEFTRIVLAPGTVEECFEAGWRAFNLAERYQCVVIVLTDNFLANNLRSIERRELGFERVTVDRGELLSAEDLKARTEPYLRYAITETGVSPRAIPGHPKGVFLACSDEHDEYGHFSDEDPENRVRMVDKRLRKLQSARGELRGPELYGPEDAEITLVGWGSSYGAMRHAVDELNGQGGSANMLHFVDIWPFPAEQARPLLQRAKRLVPVEGNATGQFAQLLWTHAEVRMEEGIHRYDGRPFASPYILERLSGQLEKGGGRRG